MPTESRKRIEDLFKQGLFVEAVELLDELSAENPALAKNLYVAHRKAEMLPVLIKWAKEILSHSRDHILLAYDLYIKHGYHFDDNVQAMSEFEKRHGVEKFVFQPKDKLAMKEARDIVKNECDARKKLPVRRDDSILKCIEEITLKTLDRKRAGFRKLSHSEKVERVRNNYGNGKFVEWFELEYDICSGNWGRRRDLEYPDALEQLRKAASKKSD